MTRIARDYIKDNQSEKLPTLYPHIVEGSPDVVALTVMDVQMYRRGTMARVEFREYPGYIIWAKGADLLAVGDQLGDDSDTWAGRRLTLEKVDRKNTQTGERIQKYVPARAERDERPRRQLRKRRGSP